MVKLHATQCEAVQTALTNRVAIICGGPGTGKSFTMKAVADIYKALNPTNYIYLAAPTGRAAKRLSEATGLEATTIHRLLAYHPKFGFQRNAEFPLKGPGLVIIDETSMVAIDLMVSLLAAIPNSVQVVLVGDVDQLPSVGPGSVLRDMIDSSAIPTTRLKYNYRQAQGSKVAEYAHLVIQGRVPPLVNNGDWEVRVVDDAGQAPDIVLAEVARARNEGHGIMDILVLCPRKQGSAGVDALNKAVRELLNPNTDEEPEYMGRFRVGDKVMVVTNDYNRYVFNGDIGVITEIIRKKDDSNCYDPGLVAEIDGSEVHFTPDALGKVALAYAMTVHKAQGAQASVVIHVCTQQGAIMLQRNLLYTGITRAKKRHVLVCQEKSIVTAVRNNRVDDRNSRLAELLKGGGN